MESLIKRLTSARIDCVSGDDVGLISFSDGIVDWIAFDFNFRIFSKTELHCWGCCTLMLRYVVDLNVSELKELRIVVSLFKFLIFCGVID